MLLQEHSDLFHEKAVQDLGVFVTDLWRLQINHDTLQKALHDHYGKKSTANSKLDQVKSGKRASAPSQPNMGAIRAGQKRPLSEKDSKIKQPPNKKIKGTRRPDRSESEQLEKIIESLSPESISVSEKGSN